MTYTMINSYRAGSYGSIDESLGTHAWFDKIAEYKGLDVDKATTRALMDTFISQLKSLGYDVPSPIGITNTVENAVYYIIWATNTKGYTIIENNIIPSVRKNLDKWQKENKTEVAKAKNKRDGIVTLDKFF